MSDENYWWMHVWLDLFFIIKATCNSCACFVWDTQACIQAIGTRDVSSEWISKYALDLERSSISTSTKTGIQKVLFPYPWVGEPHLDQGFISQMFIWRQFNSENGSLVSLTGNNFLSTNLFNWSYTFRSADNTSISMACVTNSLSTIFCSVCGLLS